MSFVFAVVLYCLTREFKNAVYMANVERVVTSHV